MECAVIYHGAPYTVIADFRRDYGITREDLGDLDLIEFTVLFLGLSGEARTVARIQQGAARVKTEVPRSRDAYLAQLGALRGQTKVVRRSSEP